MTAASSSLVSAQVWEVTSPPPVNSIKVCDRQQTAENRCRRLEESAVQPQHREHTTHSQTTTHSLNSQGTLLPRAFKTKRRKLSLEVHRHTTADDKHYEECIVRVLDPVKNHHKGSTSGSIRGNQSHVDDDASTVGGVPPEFLDHYNQLEAGYRAKYRFPIGVVTLKGTHKNGVYLQIQLGSHKQLRELIFGTLEESESFQLHLEQESAREAARQEQKLAATVQGTLPNGSVTYLVEIVSAWDIPAGDLFTSDPMVVCQVAGKVVHKTKFIPKTLTPIWTLKTDSLFLLTVNLQDFMLTDGLDCHVQDFDKLGKNETLGTVTIPPQKLVAATGERWELPLMTPPKRKKASEPAGVLAVRCRPASDYDVRFLTDYQSSGARGRKGPHEATESKGGAGNIVSYFRRQTRTIKDDKGREMKQYKIRPGPDPKRMDQTTWMTHEQIQTECLQESKQWIDSGSGKLARLFVEILGCDGLPNLDTGGRNKTDAFVSIVYEDSIFQTDIIDDCLSPRWMPWMKRAFIFHVFHTSSQLFLGVFDCDPGLNPTDDHDLVGRVSIDISNLRKDTVYTLRYNISTSARVSERKQWGTITVRLRLEIPDERKMLLSVLEPPPPMYVNVKKRKDFRCVRYTCTGKYDMEKYDLKYITSYMEELLELQHGLYYIQDGAMALFLWRGTLPVTLFGHSFLFPIHSLSAFVMMTCLVEHPQLFPSVVMFSIAWLLMSYMDFRRKLPDPWSRCKTYGGFLLTLLTGSSQSGPVSIGYRENYDEAQEFIEFWKKRVEESEKAAEKAYEENVKAQQELEREMEEVGDANADLSSKKKDGFSLDPFKPILFPVQQYLGMLCLYIRHVKFVFFWEECYIAFWVTTGCLLLSFLFLFVPWFFLLTWISRIVVWAAFGPWMKLVDVMYVSKLKPPSEEEEAAKKEKDRIKRREQLSSKAKENRIIREDTAKMRAMKKYMFGKFITRVPILKEDRHRDFPLPESTAVPYKRKQLPLSEVAMEESGYNKVRVPGQHLVGHMVPKQEELGLTEAPPGQATARALENGGSSNPDSTMGAYVSLGSLVVSAAVISWFAVPLLAAGAEKIVGSLW